MATTTVEQRSYDPSLERFVQPDPFQDEGLRTYVYAEDDPLDGTDPLGYDLCEVPLLGGVVCTTGRVLHGAWQFVAGDDFQTLSSDASPITVTANHLFWLDFGVMRGLGGWIAAGQLRPGDHLRTASGTDVVVTGLRYNVGHAVVCTLNVAHDHTFFVGTARVLVHNCIEFSTIKRRVEAVLKGKAPLPQLVNP